MVLEGQSRLRIATVSEQVPNAPWGQILTGIIEPSVFFREQFVVRGVPFLRAVAGTPQPAWVTRAGHAVHLAAKVAKLAGKLGVLQGQGTLLALRPPLTHEEIPAFLFRVLLHGCTADRTTYC